MKDYSLELSLSEEDLEDLKNNEKISFELMLDSGEYLTGVIKLETPEETETDTNDI